MAKKGQTVRVFQIAKEVGVSSKDVIAKCEAEEIPNITNHMSAVSLGLAATIREWFADAGEEEGGVATAVETAAKVDVRAARARAQKKRKATKKTASKAEVKKVTKKEAEPAAPAAEAPKLKAPEAPEARAPAQAPTAEAPPAEITAEAPPPTDAKVPEAAPKDESPKVTMNVPNRPDIISPAGPMLDQPQKTSLSGPKVIRVETPDVIPPPRARGRGVGPRTTREGRGAGVLPPTGPPAAEPGRGGTRGGGSARRNKRRSASARDEGGRSARLPDVERQFNWREQDLLEREARLNRSGGFLRQARRDNLRRTAAATRGSSAMRADGAAIRIQTPIAIKLLSQATGIRVAEILKKLFLIGKPATQNDVLDTETTELLMEDLGVNVVIDMQKTAEEQIVEQFTRRDMVDEHPRSPVVTILGHVDHGKTTLLDRIREAKVAEGEAGGITQATSAFRVPVKVGDQSHEITFIDTPGHEAFTEMRARGAKVTDIVVLVVAADDGVMPQTVESINHAKAAEVPIVVALNKIDKPEATDTNIQRILGQLAEHELNPAEWGGSTEVVRISALKSEGVNDLLEILDYQAQLLELKADFGGQAEGTVIEAQLEEGRGPVARLLVQQGQLKKGDFIAVGRAFGRVRDIVNDRGERIQHAGPSTPVAISGINEVPDAGDKFYVVKNLREAEAAAEERRSHERQRDLATEKVTLDNIFQKLSESGRKELPLIVKADVQGSVETIKAALEKLSNEEITVSIKHAAVGGINDSDIVLAETTGAIIIGFNVTTTGAARRQAEAKGVDIRLYDVIYDMTDDVKKAAEGLLEPEYKLEVLGHAEVREVFRISRVGMIAGCYVTDGVIERNAQIRVTRDGIVIEKDRRLKELKRFKDDAKEVRAGQECGMNIDGYDDIHVGDVLECYKTLEVRRTL